MVGVIIISKKRPNSDLGKNRFLYEFTRDRA
jgi:hypothetical protein